MINNNFVPAFDPTKGIEFGLYSLGDHDADPLTGKRISAKQRLTEIVEAAKLAEQAGIDVYDVGESHQEYFVSQAQGVILSAIAQATKTIKIASAATLVSVADPVRIFEEFATIDLLSNSRIEVVAGRASRIGAFELLGYDVDDYEELFEEKFELLQLINREEYVTWSGKYRAPLTNAHVIPRPEHNHLPLWRAVGGPPASAAKAGLAGIPMVLAHLSGPASYYKRTIDVYREYAKSGGFDAQNLPVTTGGFFYVAETSQQAMKEFYPYVDSGLTYSNGQGFPKQAFAQAADPHSILNVGSPEQVIEKLIYQHEMFGQQRYIAQIDLGGLPFDKMMKNIEIIGEKILPAVKKYTATPAKQKA